MDDARVGQPYVLRSYLAPSRQSGAQAERAAALVVLAQLLGGSGPNSVLARALEFDRKIAVQTSAFYDSPTAMTIRLYPGRRACAGRDTGRGRGRAGRRIGAFLAAKG
jgi:predicted Zn-dependent peptidase